MDRVQDEVQRVLSALGSPVRREILWLVADHERPAGEIAAAVAVSAPRSPSTSRCCGRRAW